MEVVYHWIGLIVFWIVAVVGVTTAVTYTISWLVQHIAEKAKIYALIVSYARNRKEFKKWHTEKVEEEERRKLNLEAAKYMEGKAKLVVPYKGYMILANTQKEKTDQIRKILRGETDGLMTVQDVLDAKNA